MLAVFGNFQDYAQRTKTAVMPCPSSAGVQVNDALDYRRIFLLSFFRGGGGESGFVDKILVCERDRVMLRSASKVCLLHRL